MAEENMQAPALVGTESALRTDSKGYNEGTKTKQLIHEIINSTDNYSVLKEAYYSGRAKDISICDKAPLLNGEKMPCIIIGSGPSLDKSIPFLKDWKGGIFCTTSHARTLVRYGIAPTHLVALDPFCTWEEIEGVDWSKTNTKLITHPGVWPTLVQKWPNDIILYRENIGPNSFYSTTQKQMYTVREDMGKGIRDPLFRYMIYTDFAMFACSPPLQLFAADKLGYGTAFLCGVDFSFPDGKDRFTDWTVKEDIKKVYVNGVPPDGFHNDINWNNLWEPHEHLLEPIPPERVPVTTNNGIPSERIHIYYKKNFYSAWRLANKTMYTTDHGAMYEIPYTDIKKLIKKQGYKYPPMKDWFIKKTSDEYLHSVGCYVVEAGEGKSFVESNNPMEEIKLYIINLMQQYTCPSCKQVFQIKDSVPGYEQMLGTLNFLTDMSKQDPAKYAPMVAEIAGIVKDMESKNKDFIDHQGQPCPVCHKSTIQHTASISLEDNMKRIEALVNKTKKE